MKKALLELRDIISMILQYVRRIDYIVLYLIYSKVKKINEKQILFLSDSREKLSGNFWFIDQKIPKEEYDVLYFFKKNLAEKKSLKEKKEMCKALATSKYILLDDFYPIIYPIPFSKKTKIIQVWHAMGAFKRVGFSRLGKVGGPKKYSITHKNYTDTIVSAEAIRKDYAQAFRMPIEDVHALGVPRTDIFFDEVYKEKIRKELYEKYPVAKEKKVILFAPTFRGNGQFTAHYPYEWVDFKGLREQLKDEYVFFFKPHPFVKNLPKEEMPEDFYIDCSNYREINDLLFITDVLITDYSSVIFEASLLDIKTVFYAPDLEEYMESRDFYYPYEEYTYGEVVRKKEQLANAIMLDADHEEKLKIFKEKFCSACDGHSSEKVARELLEIKERKV